MAVTPGQHQAWQMAAFTAGCTQGRCEVTPPSATPQDNLSQGDKKKLVSFRNLTCTQQGGGRGAAGKKKKAEGGIHLSYPLPALPRRVILLAWGYLTSCENSSGSAAVFQPLYWVGWNLQTLGTASPAFPSKPVAEKQRESKWEEATEARIFYFPFFFSPPF